MLSVPPLKLSLIRIWEICDLEIVRLWHLKPLQVNTAYGPVAGDYSMLAGFWKLKKLLNHFYEEVKAFGFKK